MGIYLFKKDILKISSKIKKNLASSSRGVRPELTEQTETSGAKMRLEQQDSPNSKTILHSGGSIFHFSVELMLTVV